MRFYGDTTDTSGATGGKHVVAISNGQDFLPSANAASAPSAGGEFGKESIDLGDIPGSVDHSANAFGEFLGGLGQIGIPGGPNIGGIAGVAAAPVRFGAEVAGNALGAVGSIPLPYLGNDPNRTNAHLGDVPGLAAGAVGDVLSAPGNFVAEQSAKARLEVASHKRTATAPSGEQPNEYARALAGQVEQDQGIPPAIQARLDAGENIDQLAKEMAEGGIGYSNNPIQNTVASVVLDPLNLISPGVGKVASIAKNADRALQAGRDLGVGERFIGTAYGAASRGLSAGGQALVDHVLGPTTSGVFHALGTRPYLAIRSGLSKLSPDYGQAFEDAMAVGAGQLPPAIVAREIADDVALRIRRKAALPDLQGLGDNIESSLAAKRTLNPDELERRAEELLLRVAPDFAGRDATSIADETVRKLAVITETSPEDAAAVLGSHASDLKTAQTVHLAFYGKAVSDFGAARAEIGTARNIDLTRLTIVAPDTLTTERAAKVLADGPEALANAVEHYSILANRFSGTAFDHAKVIDFIKKLATEGALVDAVRLPTTGKNALPKALGDWRAKYADIGYDLGFGPKGGVKTIVDDSGDLIHAEPFVSPTTEVDPLTLRNPLGRFMDAMFRGVTQTTIVLDSRARFVGLVKDAGISPGEARGLHKVVLEEARRQGTTPRGLDNYADLFREYLGPDRYALLTAKHDPAFLVMKSFEGNLSRVGVTQKLTGIAKTAGSERLNLAAQVAEKIYPTIKFRLSPLFQLQELIESKVWNALRGIAPRPASPEIAALYDELSQLPETRHFTEAGHYLHLWGSESVTRAMGGDTLLGRALHRIPDVADSKRKAQALQIISEHPAAFEDAVNSINPRFWQTMVDAYGTTDARTITERFMSERFDLQDPAKALAKFDALMPKTFASADEQTVWQAFRESLRSTSQQSFKTHFFDTRRGWLERSVNHPYLGLYPASYMWGKVLPEFARFLLLRPFGLNAPLLGARAYQRVQEAFVARMAGDPGFAKAVKDNADLTYAFATLMPALPNDLPANAPAWARHLSQDLAGHKKIDPQTFVTREAQDAATYAFGPTRTLSVGLGALGDVGDLYGRLTHAAAQLDAQFPHG